MRRKKPSKVLGILITLAFPIAMFLFMELVCRRLVGRGVFATNLDIRNFIRSAGISVCTALALSFNLGSGRFDLSLGAQRMAATILGLNFALWLGLNSVGALLVALVFGMAFGLAVGAIFAVFRVPPMVLGVGMTMIIECIAFAGSNAQGVQLFGKGYDGLSSISFTVAVVLIAVSVIILLSQFTKFGYHMRAIGGSQRIAKNSGINIFLHAALCYMLAGGLVSFSGVFDTAFKGGMDASIGMTSNGVVMASCFAMFLGGYFAKWSNRAVGILFATITLSLLSTGLSVLRITPTGGQLINMALFLLFLVFRANEHVFADRRARKMRIAEAMAKREAMSAATAAV